jgi:diguanylate cyclase (GGDEF)-like protein/PAS domain S-box-containing protein
VPCYAQVDNLAFVVNLKDLIILSVCSKELSLQKLLNTYVNHSLYELLPDLKEDQNEIQALHDNLSFHRHIESDSSSLLIHGVTINTNDQEQQLALFNVSVPDPDSDCSFMYLLSRALESAQHGVTISDARLPNQPLIYCNKAFTQLTEYEAYEVLGKNCRFLQGDDSQQPGIAIIKEAIHQATECKTILRNYKKSGEMFWNQISISPVFNGKGELTHLVGIQYDITDQMVAEGALKESENRYRTLFETNVDGIAYYDLDGNCLDANTTYCEMLGKQWDQVVNHNSSEITPLRWKQLDIEIKQNQIENNIHCQEYEKELIHSAGNAFPVNIRQCLHLNEFGRPMAFWLLIRDITRQKETLEKLEHSKELLTETGKLAKVGGWEMQENEQIHLTQEAAKILRLEQNAISLQELSNLFYNDHKLLLRKSIEITRDAHEGLDLTLKIEHQDFSQWLRVQGHTKQHDGPQTIIVGAIQDITEAKIAQDKLMEHETHLKYLAHHDALTGLPNRWLYNDRVKHAIDRAQREDGLLSVLLLDLDRFKIINDSLGHEIGDRFLKSIATRAQRAIRDSDTFARLGGDEFVVLLEDVEDPQDVIMVAQKLQAAISKPVQLENHNLHSSASIGISMYPEDGEHVDELLRCADAAMYRVKEQGKNNFQFYTKEMNNRAVELLELENDMHHAIDEEQFLLHFQPQISLSDFRIVGLESLVRWHHPQKGMISPGDFIPIAEESGMILELGEWVLMESCRQAKQWLDNGYQFGRVAVNLSAKQFHRSDIVYQVKQALKKYHLPPDNLELEITEGIAIENIEVTIETLNELKSLGIHLAIDDFGTGYSSLSYLKRFSIDKLKIDKSFVDDILTDEGGAAIATSTIALAHQMGLQVIAEGVETEQQACYLQEHKCDEAQGYLYSRPLSNKDAENFFNSYAR